MSTLLISLISLSLGIAIGWYAERLLRIVSTLRDRKPVETGVVRPTIAPGSAIEHDSNSAVVRPRSPKEVAADNAREFNDTFEV